MKKLLSLSSSVFLFFFVFILNVLPASAATQKIEAENAVKVTSRPENFNDSAASGGVAVENVDLNGAGLQFNNVSASTQIKVEFNSEQSGKIGLYVNNVRTNDLTFTGNGVWGGAYKSQTYNVNIPQNATVKIQFDEGDNAMNIDFVEFTTASTTPTPTKTPTPTPHTSVTPTPTKTPTPTPHISVTPTPKLNIFGNRFQARGTVAAVSGNTFTLGNQVITIDPSKVDNFTQKGIPSVGANVNVSGIIKNGTFYATDITVVGHENEFRITINGNRFELAGTVASVTNNTFTVADKIITVDSSQVNNFEQKGLVTTGAKVKVSGVIKNQTMYAKDITVVGNQNEFRLVITNNKFEIKGQVTNVSGNTVTIADKTITLGQADKTYQQTGIVTVGSTVRVLGVINNGAMFAREVVVIGGKQNNLFMRVQNLNNGDIQVEFRGRGSKDIVVQLIQQLLSLIQNMP